jgi:TDG/mug DNA glycosylase family protein
MNQITDILDNNLRILFIGFNPGLRSAETGHHFAGYSNRFWKLLKEAGLTPGLFKPEEDRKLLTLGYGITNIVARPSREASEITKDEYALGREELKQKLAFYKPLVACYVGIGVYREFSKIKNIICGRQPVSIVPGVLDFVVPSPSGKNPILFSVQLEYYRELQRLTAK